MFLKRKSLLTGKENYMFIRISEEEYESAYEEWVAGKLIQEAFPNLNAGEREFIKTGITSEEWDAIYTDEEDSNEEL